MRYLQIEVQNAGFSDDLAYHHAHWTRQGAPLMDELGAVLDHVDAFAEGGPCEEGNLVTSCAKCNGRKSAALLTNWEQREKRIPIKGKYGEPQRWDGLSAVFVVLAERNSDRLSAEERTWLKAFRKDAPSKLDVAS